VSAVLARAGAEASGRGNVRTLTLFFYAVVTFFLGLLALDAVYIRVAVLFGDEAAQVVIGIVLVMTFAAPIIFIAAIPFAGTRRKGRPDDIDLVLPGL
jgi:hypothetical protein